MTLVVHEAETEELKRYLQATDRALATSRLALVEVVRAVSVAAPGERQRAEAERVVESCYLVAVGRAILSRAAGIASSGLRTLDAIHLATALEIGAEDVLAYDRRLAQAAEAAGLRVVQPGVG